MVTRTQVVGSGIALGGATTGVAIDGPAKYPTRMSGYKGGSLLQAGVVPYYRPARRGGEILSV